MKTEKVNKNRISIYLIKVLDTASILLVIAAFFSSVFSVSTLFPEAVIDAKYFFTCVLLVVAGILISLRLMITTSYIHMALFNYTEKWIEIAALAICVAQALFYIFQEIGDIRPYGDYVAGSFDNIAGLASCLSLSLPLGNYLMDGSNKSLKVILYTTKMICIAAIFLTQSRTGMLCVVVWIAMTYCSKSKQKYLYLFFPILILCALFYKSNSSKGRWFILLRTLDLIKVHPLFGWGQGGCRAHYMDAQADYFACHPFDVNSILADNIRHPLNEYIALVVDFGVMGLLGVLAFLLFTIWYAYRYKSEKTNLWIQGIMLLGVFSFFSYPFQYPFTWLFLALCLWGIFYAFLVQYIRLFSFFMLLTLVSWGYYLGYEWSDNVALTKMQEKTKLGLSELNLSKFKKMYPRRKNDSRFLFYYASDLYFSEHYLQALQEARACKTLLADYQLMLLMGDIFKKLGEKDSTLYYYRRAHYMCPSRFSPLYEMWRTHKEFGDSIAYRKLRHVILTKSVKVNSLETAKMIREVKYDKSW